MNFFNRMIRVQEGAGEEGASGLGGEAPPAAPPEDLPPEPTEFSGPEWAKDYELDHDITGDPSLKPINDVSTLIKSYVHAQRKIGQKGAILPTENSSKEEWDDFYQKTGVPLEQQDYIKGLEFPTEDGESSFDQTFNENFATKAHELRIRPDQAKGLYDFFNAQAKQTSERFSADTETEIQGNLDKLQSEWGAEAYSVRLAKAGQLLTENVGPESLAYLKESGLGRNAEVVRILGTLADKLMGEGAIPKGDSSFGRTKSELQAEINSAMSDPKDAYLNSNHADHKRRVTEVQALFAKLDAAN